MTKTQSAKMINVEKLSDGKLRLYQLTTSVYWQARFFTEGKYKTTLDTENYKIPKQQAIDWYEDLRYKQKQGIRITGSYFQEIIPSFLKYQQTLVKGGELTERMATDYSIRIQGGCKYFNDYLVSDIQLKQLHNFREYRMDKDGVSGNTVRHDFVAIRQLLKYCVLQGHIQSLPEFSKNKRKINQIQDRGLNLIFFW